MQQIFQQVSQFLQQSIAAIFRFVNLVWTWSMGEISKVFQMPWQNWPLWKQILLVVVIAGVVWALFKAAGELWSAAERTLAAFASLLAVFIKTLPYVVLAGLIAVGGIYVINHVDLSSVRVPAVFSQAG